jgi:hypothetical protein
MAKCLDVGDRLAPGGQHQRDVHLDLAAVMTRSEPPAGPTLSTGSQ